MGSPVWIFLSFRRFSQLPKKTNSFESPQTNPSQLGRVFSLLEVCDFLAYLLHSTPSQQDGVNFFWDMFLVSKQKTKQADAPFCARPGGLEEISKVVECWSEWKFFAWDETIFALSFLLNSFLGRCWRWFCVNIHWLCWFDSLLWRRILRYWTPRRVPQPSIEWMREGSSWSTMKRF